jgi:4-carboxymuconolactone decarboxylase
VPSRLPGLRPQDLDERQRAVYDAIAGGPRATGPQLFALRDEQGALNGPFNAMLFAPEVGAALQDVGSALRYRTSLSDRVRELAILLVAAHWDSAFERYAHEAIGAAAGLTADEIEAIRRREPLALPDPTEALAIEVVVALLAGDGLDAMTYDRAAAGLGPQALVEISTLIGYYGTLALQLRLFDIGIPSA